MKTGLKEEKGINDYNNAIIEKLCSYYDEKYGNLPKEERKELFCSMITEGSVNQQFDSNEFYKALTPEEQKSIEEIGY